MDARHKIDFYTWAKEQADLARTRSANAFDWDNVAEELDALGKAEARELRSRLIVLIAHLIKYCLQPERRGRAWTNTIANQRDEIALHLIDNPGLKSIEQDVFQTAWGLARRVASTEMDVDIDAIPLEPMFSLEEAKSIDLLPQA